MQAAEKFLGNKRSTRIGSPQLKIKNQNMAYHGTFGKVLYRTCPKLSPLTENYIMKVLGRLVQKYRIAI